MTIRIVHVITRSDTLGGAQYHVAQLATALERHGHEVTVLAGGKGPFLHHLRERGIRAETLHHLTRPIHPWHDLLSVFELRSRLIELNPDLVALHSSKAGWLGRVVGWHLGYPVVFTAHGWAFTEGTGHVQRRFYRLVERLTAPLAHRIITVSEYDRQLALRHRIASDERVKTVHNGVPETSERADPAGSPCRIVMVARLDHPKLQELLVRALGHLQHLDWHLDLVGDGPKRAEIARLVHQLGLERRVDLLGFRHDVSMILARSHVFALLSRYEGLPLSVLEAMRAGLPVVASRVGGVPEAVKDDHNGFLIDGVDVASLRERLETLIASPERRVQFGLASRELFLKEFTEQKMILRTIEVYQEAIEERTREGRPGGGHSR